MTHNELLKTINSPNYRQSRTLDHPYIALRAVVELAIKQLDTTNMPAEQVGWFHEGYNLAMDNVIDAINKELG